MAATTTLTGGSGLDISASTRTSPTSQRRSRQGRGPRLRKGQDKLEFGIQSFASFVRAGLDAFDSNNDGVVSGADIYVTDNWLGMTIDYGEVMHQALGLTAAEGYLGRGRYRRLLGIHSLSAGDFVF